MTFVCPNCKTAAKPGDKFCRACGAAVPSDQTWVGDGSPSDAGHDHPHVPSGLNFALPFGISAASAFSALAYGAGGLLALLLSYQLFSQAFAFPAWEIVLASLAVVIVLMRIFTFSGLGAVLHYGIYLSIYCAGGLAVLAVVAANGVEWPAWQIWLIYTGLYALLFIGLPPLTRRVIGPVRDRTRFQAIAEKTEEAHMQREAELALLPSHSWYLLASWVTGVAMVGSFATTAIGFYEEIVDPYSHWLIRFGIPIGLSAMAAFIIWSGWNFVFLRMRIAAHVWSRLLAYVVGLAILVPLTLAIHTVFGIIGVGGTEGLRAHYMWYADVLSGYHGRADAERQAEVGFRPPLDLAVLSFKKSADSEKQPGAKCGQGEGDLFRYYNARSADIGNILKLISDRENFKSNLPKLIENLRKEIRDPGKSFRAAQEDLEEQFNALRPEILGLENHSVMDSIQLFISQLAIVVEQEAFFKDWNSCQANRKDVLKDDVTKVLTILRAKYDEIGRKIVDIRKEAAAHIPRERRIESFPIFDAFVAPAIAQSSATGSQTIDSQKNESDEVPIFVPMRPFWAVVSYAGQLPGYIALQLALDFSPAILGVLFAVLAPLPTRPTAQMGPTRLGRLADTATDSVQAWLHRRGAAPKKRPQAAVIGEVAGAALDVGRDGGAASDAGPDLEPKVSPLSGPTTPADPIRPSPPEPTRTPPPEPTSTLDEPDEKARSLLVRIAPHKAELFVDHSRCRALLTDTLLSHPEIDAMMAALDLEIPQGLLGQPEPIAAAAIGNFAERLSQKAAVDTNAARTAVIMWARGLGLKLADDIRPGGPGAAAG